MLNSHRRAAAHLDPIAALASRTDLASGFGAAIGRAQAHSAMLSVLSVDLADFRAVANGAAHVDGEQLIDTLADRLRRCARRTDLVTRLDGDVYLIVAECQDGPFAAHRLADRVLSVLQQPLGRSPQEPCGKASIGVATASGPQLSADTLLRRAHRAMLQARQAGGNRRVDADAPL